MCLQYAHSSRDQHAPDQRVCRHCTHQPHQLAQQQQACSRPRSPPAQPKSQTQPSQRQTSSSPPQGQHQLHKQLQELWKTTCPRILHPGDLLLPLKQMGWKPQSLKQARVSHRGQGLSLGSMGSQHSQRQMGLQTRPCENPSRPGCVLLRDVQCNAAPRCAAVAKP